MISLASGIDYVDLNFLGFPGIIATAVLHGPAGVALIDPGPSTTLPNLRAALDRGGIAMRDVRQILLTHIHLDHAGGAGTLVKENPHIEVFVHERGAPHLADPAKLLSSATRLYGQDMDRLWGEFLAVPGDRLRVLQGGETVSAGGRTLAVAYTPGHASHHVSYFEPSTRVAFVGDTAGIRRGRGLYVMPASPPPDVDLEIWRESERRILDWDPDTLFLTHFGPFNGARPHFQELMDRLVEWSRIARRLVSDETLAEEQREEQFVAAAVQDLRRVVGVEEAEQYSRAGSIAYSWHGLARYWRKRLARGTSLEADR
jgi:glyoxylase-like metal-dependent hydrolase (beta-lactamase superfamily II)